MLGPEGAAFCGRFVPGAGLCGPAEGRPGLSLHLNPNRCSSASPRLGVLASWRLGVENTPARSARICKLGAHPRNVNSHRCGKSSEGCRMMAPDFEGSFSNLTTGAGIMMRTLRARRWRLTPAGLLLVFSFGILLVTFSTAQQAGAKRPLNHNDYDSWRAIQLQQLTHDAKFLGYALNPQDDDGEVVVRNLFDRRGISQSARPPSRGGGAGAVGRRPGAWRGRARRRRGIQRPRIYGR